MKNIVFYFCLFCFVISGFSQGERKIIKGEVVNDSINIANVTILNKTNDKWTTTNEGGFFEIPVEVGDSILVSAINIRDEYLLITEEIIKNKTISICVEESVEELSAVVLNDLLGASVVDFSVAFKPTLNPDRERMRRQEVQRLAETDPLGNTQGVNLLSGFAFLAKLFKTEEKTKVLTMAEKLQEWEHFKIDFINEFGLTFFTKELMIPEVLVDEFFLFCKREKDISKMYFDDEKLSLLNVFVKQSIVYKQLNNML